MLNDHLLLARGASLLDKVDVQKSEISESLLQRV